MLESVGHRDPGGACTDDDGIEAAIVRRHGGLAASDFECLQMGRGRKVRMRGNSLCFLVGISTPQLGLGSIAHPRCKERQLHCHWCESGTMFRGGGNVTNAKEEASQSGKVRFLRTREADHFAMLMLLLFRAPTYLNRNCRLVQELLLAILLPHILLHATKHNDRVLTPIFAGTSRPITIRTIPRTMLRRRRSRYSPATIADMFFTWKFDPCPTCGEGIDVSLSSPSSGNVCRSRCAN